MVKFKKIKIVILLSIVLTTVTCLVNLTSVNASKKQTIIYNNSKSFSYSFNKAKNGLLAEYYSNLDFKGFMYSRIDSRISFDWEDDSPYWNFKPDRFSVRWTGQVEPLYTEEYTFHTITDDGIRLWINNQLIIDQWDKHAATEFKGAIQLAAKQRYNLKMEYYQDRNDACAKLLWSSRSQSKEIIPKARLYSVIVKTPTPTPTPAPTPTPTADPSYAPIYVNLSSYYNEDAFSYDTSRTNGNFDTSGNTYSADLASSSSVLENIPFLFGSYQNNVNNSIKCSGQTIIIDNRKCKTIYLAGSATNGNNFGVFRVNYTDGSYSDIAITMKDWCTTDLSGEKALQSMSHRHTASADETKNAYIFEYTLSTDTNKYVKSIMLPNQNNMHILAITLMSSGNIADIGTGLRGEYFDNMDLTDSALARIDPTINFDWGTGTPNSIIGPNTFSARWTGTVMPEYSETYTFYTQSDDGARLWVNNTLIIDHWTEQSVTEYSGSINLAAGQKYNIKLEYFDKQDKASVKLYWSSPSRSKQIIPQSKLFN